MDSLQLCNGSLPCCLPDMYILESEFESSSEARAGHSVGHGDIVSNFLSGLIFAQALTVSPSAMIASIIKTVQTRVLAISDSEPTIARIHYDRWLYIETYLVIVTASIPCIRSLLRPTNSRKISSRDTYELSSRRAVSSSRSRTRRRDSSLDGKRIINGSEGDVSLDDDVHRGYHHNETPHLGESNESVINCV